MNRPTPIHNYRRLLELRLSELFSAGGSLEALEALGWEVSISGADRGGRIRVADITLPDGATVRVEEGRGKSLAVLHHPNAKDGHGAPCDSVELDPIPFKLAVTRLGFEAFEYMPGY